MEFTHVAEMFPVDPTDLRTRILMNAGRLFQRQGYAETPMTAIASASHITPAALYWHFKNKEDILFEFLLRAHEAFETEMARAIDPHDEPVAALRRLVYASTCIRLVGIETAGMDTSLSLGQLSRSLTPEHVDQLRAIARKHVTRCREIIARGVAAGRFTVPDEVSAAFAILTMCEAASLWYQRDRGHSMEQIAEAYEVYALRAVGVDLDAEPAPPASGRATAS